MKRLGLLVAGLVALFEVWYRRQPVGTRSVVAGAHFPPIHGLANAIAWWRVYDQVPKKIPLWFAFFVHDIGYLGLDNMDGPTGQMHPERGAWLMHQMFDGPDYTGHKGGSVWLYFTGGHSRYYAKRIKCEVSELMRSDKYATCIYPLWLYLLLVLHSGECWEYVALHLAYHNKQGTGNRWRDLYWWVTDLRREWAESYGPDRI